MTVGLVVCQDNDEDLGERLGLLGTSLGLNPLGEEAKGKHTDTDNENDMSAPLISVIDPFETIPDEMITSEAGNLNIDIDGVSIEDFENKNNESSASVFNFSNNPTAIASDKFTEEAVPQSSAVTSQCCCVPEQDTCSDPFGGTDLVSSGLIDDRLEQKPKQTEDTSNSLTFRISPDDLSSTPSCPLGMKACCYEPDLNLEIFGISCLTPEQALRPEQWKQGCRETARPAGTKQCGTRSFVRPARGLKPDEASPGEFPWTCMILTMENGFVGNCAIIPGRDAGTKMVITAAHKLNKIADGR